MNPFSGNVWKAERGESHAVSNDLSRRFARKHLTLSSSRCQTAISLAQIRTTYPCGDRRAKRENGWCKSVTIKRGPVTGRRTTNLRDKRGRTRLYLSGMSGDERPGHFH